jgi:hypothetical protein
MQGLRAALFCILGLWGTSKSARHSTALPSPSSGASKSAAEIRIEETMIR